MVSRGWTVPTWPLEYGGAGLSAADTQALQEEMERIQAWMPLYSFGITMLAPVLLAYGSEAQKRRHLPPIARGEIRWCQGFSEPQAGSDLASLKTRAEDAGDHYRVNGQKIWTSYADQCDWIFCLVRTNPAVKKQAGISFLLIDMTSAGVTTRPIEMISGESPFCETFLSDVRVPKENLVGPVDGGWELAKFLLGFERESIGRASSLFDLTTLLPAAAQRAADEGGSLHPDILRADVVRAEVDTRAYRLTLRRYREEMEASNSLLGDRASILKYYGAELNKRRAELLLRLEGFRALEQPESGLDPGSSARRWLRSKGNSIEGGTSEIMLDIIARRILALPVG
jgi:alkylation response protein AidB-like acyl-CoA dehydrogenase